MILLFFVSAIIKIRSLPILLRCSVCSRGGLKAIDSQKLLAEIEVFRSDRKRWQTPKNLIKPAL